jgi:hypothetical protein
MLETISLDSKTLIIRADKENDLSDVINYIVQKKKLEHVKSFLKFTSTHRVLEKDYAFNRKNCYDR